MNKVFFVVFLGIILGAMTLIFVNQASSPLATILASHQTPSSEGGATAPQATPPTTLQPDVDTSLQSKPEDVKPVSADTESPKATAPTPELAKPDVPHPEVSNAAPPAPEPVKPEPVTPEPVKPEVPKPEPVKPEVAKPEPAKPEPVKPDIPSTAPVTTRPEPQVNPGGVPAKKTVALVNIGLHFRGNGMVFRIEADASFSYKTFALPSPDRYVVDLLGTWTNMYAPTVPANTLIKSVRVGKQASGPRLVFDMQRVPKNHSVNWVSPTVLEIVIE